MRITRTLLLALLFFTDYAASEDFIKCYVSIDSSTCVEKPDVHPREIRDPFSEGFWENLFSYTGSQIWDGALSSGKDAGKELGKQALASVAASFGVPSPVLNLIGFGPGGKPDISNSEVVARIESIINQQTTTLLAAIRNGDETLYNRLEQLIADSCVNEFEAIYETSLQNIEGWKNYSLSRKNTETYLVSNALVDLQYLRNLYASGRHTDSNQNCFTKRHVELFSLMMNLASIEINSRLSLTSIVSTSNDERLSDSLVDYNIFLQGMENLLEYISYSKLSDSELKYDVKPIGNKANVWWDAVAYTSQDPHVVIENIDYKYILNNCPKIEIKQGSYADKLLASNIPKETAGGTFYRCEGYIKYKVRDVEYSISLVFAFTPSDYMPNPNDYKSILVHDNFFGDVFVSSKVPSPGKIAGLYCGLAGNTFVFSCDESEKNKLLLGAVSMFRYHMDLEYANLLQQAYMPYQELLDSFWANIGVTRNKNRLDFEVERVASVFDLDIDGVSLYDELIEGTNPYNPDSDNDGMPDGWEVRFGMNPLDRNDATLNPDGDSYSNVEEYLKGLNPLIFDEVQPNEISDFRWWALSEPRGVDPEVSVTYSSNADHCSFELEGVTLDNLPASGSPIRLLEFPGIERTLDLTATLTCFSKDGLNSNSVTKTYEDWHYDT